MTISVTTLSSARVDIGTKDDLEIFAGDDFDRTYIVAENFDPDTGEVTNPADFSGFTGAGALFNKDTGAKIIDFDSVTLDNEGKVNPVYDNVAAQLVLAAIPTGRKQFAFRYEIQISKVAFERVLLFGNFNVQRKFI